MGFNNGGRPRRCERLAARERGAAIVGVNIGANKDSADRIADYATGVAAMAPLADYLDGQHQLAQHAGPARLAGRGRADANCSHAVRDARGAGGPPVFLKVAPDLEPADIDAIVRAALDTRLDALIVSNTTISRPPLRSRHAGEAGGLSGAPLQPLALDALRDFRNATRRRAAADRRRAGSPAPRTPGQRIRAGASLVQLYSALVYRGPGLARRIAAGSQR